MTIAGCQDTEDESMGGAGLELQRRARRAGQSVGRKQCSLAVPGNLNPDCDADTWAQHLVATLAAGTSLESIGDSVQGDVRMGDPVTHPASPLPPSTSGAAAKKQSRIAVPTRVSARNKDAATSKQKPGSTNKPKAPASAKGKGVPPPPTDSPGASTSASALDPTAVCGGVVGMMPALPGEQLTDTMARLNLNQLRIAVAILELKDVMVNRDKDAMQREEALHTQVTDTRAYIGDVITAHAQPPITMEHVTALGAKVDALTHSTEQVTALGVKVDALTNSTDGRFASFQTVMNAITDRIATSPSSHPAAAVTTTSPAVIQQHPVSTNQVTGAIAPSMAPSVPIPPLIPASPMMAAPSAVPVPLPTSTYASQPMASFPQGSYAPPSMPPPATYAPGVLFSQPHAIQQNWQVPASSAHTLPSAAGPPSRQLRTIHLTNVTYGTANVKSTTHTLLQHVGLQLRDATVYRRIGYDGLNVTFKLAEHAARLMAAVQTEERFTHMGADLLNADNGPTIDDICGTAPPSWSAQGSSQFASG
ncbi:uncharacterized protein ARMOST_17402 [Armillaria ostoyae]|uniref:Uncharacterized protein n=1 Tax=Armillaria ostoyae TaxID=47428 RepID=A0A284RYW4_ARMOS|nr:uncharacterized protein ARMOST_17402 [Armillaria ostoyae]